MTEQEQRAHEYTAAYAAKYGITEEDLLAAIYRGHLAYLINRSPMDEVKAEYEAAQTGEDGAGVELDALGWYKEFSRWKVGVQQATGQQPTTTFLEWLEEEDALNPISQTCPECPECGSINREDAGDAILCLECQWAEAKAELRERELAQMPHEGSTR